MARPKKIRKTMTIDEAQRIATASHEIASAAPGRMMPPTIGINNWNNIYASWTSYPHFLIAVAEDAGLYPCINNLCYVYYDAREIMDSGGWKQQTYHREDGQPLPADVIGLLGNFLA